MSEIYWATIKGLAKVAPWLAGAVALAMTGILLTLAFVGLLALAGF